jgi:hypothetical protein
VSHWSMHKMRMLGWRAVLALPRGVFAFWFLSSDFIAVSVGFKAADLQSVRFEMTI